MTIESPVGLRRSTRCRRPVLSPAARVTDGRQTLLSASIKPHGVSNPKASSTAVKPEATIPRSSVKQGPLSQRPAGLPGSPELPQSLVSPRAALAHPIQQEGASLTNLAICKPRGWTRLPGSGFDEVNLPCLLRNGQAFRWVQTSAGEWTSTVHGRLVTLRQQLPDRDPSTGIFCLPQLSTPACRNLAGAETETAYDVDFTTYEPPPGAGTPVTDGASDVTRHETEQMAAWLVDYFQLGTRLAPLYDQWRRADPAHFAAKAPHYPGIRMLRQDPLENVLSFICSSNNAIPRIATMVQTLARLYGSPVGRVPTHPETVFYAFPTLLQLAHEAPAAMEVRLRQHGFGYRAKFIAATVQALLAHEQAYTADRRPPKACPPHEVPVGSRYLTSLRQQPREDARAALMALPGVGAKVADCICLMSLDQADRIPVDTHVWQIATRDYGLFRDDAALPKTLTPRVYDQIGQHFGALFGPYAGWAHTVLFAADLRMAFYEASVGQTLTSKRPKSAAAVKEEASSAKRRPNPRPRRSTATT